jgi:hypothetical protein
MPIAGVRGQARPLRHIEKDIEHCTGRHTCEMDNPTEQELEAMAGHVLYEQRMWQWSVERLVEIREENAEHNGLIEVFLLHSRCLTEFFQSQPRQDDVVAGHYVPGWKPHGSVTFLSSAMAATNKRWGHLSLYRLDKERVKEDLDRWSHNVHHMSVTWSRFLSELSDERRRWFEAEASARPEKVGG